VTLKIHLIHKSIDFGLVFKILNLPNN